MLSWVKRVAGRSRAAIVVKYMMANWHAGFRYRRGNHAPKLIPNRSFRESVDEYLDNVDRAFRSYIDNGNIGPERIEGADILELGPGSSFAMALRFLALGANQVVCLDRFRGIHEGEAARVVYLEMRGRLDDTQREKFDRAVDCGNRVVVNPERIVYVSGIGVEEADVVLKDRKFDLIVSMAVLEHIYDGDAAFAAMDRLLKPGGKMVHGVDLRDHGIFSGKGHHPLTFLTIGEAIYRSMSQNIGLPNRILLPFYREKMQQLGYQYKLLIGNVVGRDDQIHPHKETLTAGTDYPSTTVELIRKIRSRLAPRFRTMSEEDLMVSTFVVSAKKP